MEITEVEGGAGVRLHVRRTGRREGRPIVFLHGWSQHHLCWSRQLTGPLAQEFDLVAFDLRGHGASEAPDGLAHYADGDLWAADLHAVIAGLGLEKPVLVAWSYGGLVVADYLRVHGDSAIGGVNFVAASLVIGKDYIGDYTGATFIEHAARGMSKDQAKAIAGMIAFAHACAVKPLPRSEIERMIASSMLTRPDVRRAMSSRDADYRPVLKALGKPCLFTQGEADTIIMPRMTQESAAIAADARLSWYPGVGHMPFLEEAERFDAELAEFARSLG
ncbi:MAG: alpha/beta hydrolase [Salinarimonadaceae bacterium]|nr:MAG: alpha/beta hydrolase [Salinarimonadaceae bacterium]